MLASISILAAIALFLVSLSIHFWREEKKTRLERRLKRATIDARRLEKGKVGGLRRWLSRAAVEMSEENFLLSLIVLVACVLAGGIAIGLPLLLAAFLSLLFVFPTVVYIEFRGKRRQVKLEENLEQALLDMIGVLKAGLSLPEAIKAASQEAEEPLRTELKRFEREIEFGVGIEDALLDLSRRNESDVLNLVIQGIILCKESGGRLVTLLERAAIMVRSRVRTKSEIRSLASQSRSTALAVAIMPVVVLTIVWFLNPTYLAYLKSPLGNLVLIYAALSFSVGFLLMYKMTDLVPGGKGEYKYFDFIFD